MRRRVARSELGVIKVVQEGSTIIDTMPEVTYTEARANFAGIWDKLVADREVFVVQRRGKEDIAMLPASELAGLMETAHLLRSPRNAERLLAALSAARDGTGEPMSLEELKREAELG